MTVDVLKLTAHLTSFSNVGRRYGCVLTKQPTNRLCAGLHGLPWSPIACTTCVFTSLSLLRQQQMLLRPVVVVVTRPLPRDGGRPWSPRSRETLQGLDQRLYRDRESPKSERGRVRSWTVQNEMRGVLGRMSTGAERRILDYANPREIRT